MVECAVDCLGWRNKYAVYNSRYRHISMVSSFDFDMGTFSCLPRIWTLNMSMLVACLSNFTTLPQKKLKYRNMKLPHHAITWFNLYSTSRLSSQLDEGWAEKGVGMKYVAIFSLAGNITMLWSFNSCSYCSVQQHCSVTFNSTDNDNDDSHNNLHWQYQLNSVAYCCTKIGLIIQFQIMCVL